MGTDWSEVTRRVAVEAASPHPEDVVLVIGSDAGVVDALRPRVRRVEILPLSPTVSVPAGVSVVVLHDALRRLAPEGQAALLRRLGAALPPRALLVIGDVMWSMPRSMVDEPEQFGDAIEHASTVEALERQLRSAGFLPDTHRFGVGRAVCIALRGPNAGPSA